MDINILFCRVSCPENYFLGELLYTTEDELLNAKPCTLYVATLGQDWKSDQPVSVIADKNSAGQYTTKSLDELIQNETGDSCKSVDCSNKSAMMEFQSSESGDSSETKHSEGCSKISTQMLRNSDDAVTTSDMDKKTIKALKELVCSLNSVYILDFDLDFFSTRDPFQEIYSEKQYSLLRLLYEFHEPPDKTNTVSSRKPHLKHLSILIIFSSFLRLVYIVFQLEYT